MRRRYVVGLLVLLIAAVVFRVAGPAAPRSPDPRFPGLAHVDERLERSLREAWPRGIDPDEREQENVAFAKVARAGGADAARAIFRILVKTYRGKPGSFDSYGSFYQDEQREIVGWVLGERADESVQKMMIRALPERDFHPAFRRALAVALCRPGTDIGPLLDRILDRQEDNSFRRRLLLRLPRLAVPPPKELRDLLYQPFGDLDICAGATLARMGDPEAPSLVLEGFDYVGWDDGDLYHLILATERFTGEDIKFSKTVSVPGRGPESIDAWHEKRATRHKAVLASWLEGREPDTEFERGYRAYLASDQRRREMSLKSFDDVLNAGNEFDLAAASLLLTGYKPATLGALDRLTRFLRRKLDGVTDPSRTIAILNHWIPKRHESTDAMVRRSGRLSFLPYVFDQDAGNCLGYSTLYLALAERLDLPLHGVLVPGHCFVRYDVGRFRRNIETTALGAETKDEQYRAGPLELNNRTKRQVLSAILSNYAATCRFYSNFDHALVACRRALQLDPTNAAALANYATSLYQSELHGRTELLEALRETRQRMPEDAGPLLLMAEVHMEIGAYDRALELVEEAVGLDHSPRTLAAQARCLARLGRLKEAREALGENPDDPALRGAEIEILLLEDPARAQEIVAQKTRETDDALIVLVDAASVLVKMDEAAAALAVLKQGADLANRSFKNDWIESGAGILLDPRSWSLKRQRYHLIRAKALHALGRKGAAREALAEAEKLGGSFRLMLEVRDLLR